ASASVLSGLLTGMDRAAAQELIGQFREMLRSRGQIEADEEIFGDAAAFSGVSRYAARVKCAMLGWVAAEDALTKAL
ncbi:iron-sulfur cluster assembly scaffold protein, partial [Escherichia coli]|nr:iron-sulfur cluster assembly scaffold protein [Escherichia coli]